MFEVQDHLLWNAARAGVSVIAADVPRERRRVVGCIALESSDALAKLGSTSREFERHVSVERSRAREHADRADPARAGIERNPRTVDAVGQLNESRQNGPR